MKRYKIAEVFIEIDENDITRCMCNYVGYQSEQGGMVFGYGNFGTSSIESSLDILKYKLNEATDEIIQQIKNKSEKP